MFQIDRTFARDVLLSDILYMYLNRMVHVPCPRAPLVLVASLRCTVSPENPKDSTVRCIATKGDTEADYTPS